MGINSRARKNNRHNYEKVLGLGLKNNEKLFVKLLIYVFDYYILSMKSVSWLHNGVHIKQSDVACIGSFIPHTGLFYLVNPYFGNVYAKPSGGNLGRKTKNYTGICAR